MAKRVRTTRRLEAWLKDTSVALFVLNIQRRLVFFNFGCEQLTGWMAAELLGQVCDYVSEFETNSLSALLSSLAAPVEVWNGQAMTTPSFLGRRQSDPIECMIHFYPLTDAEHHVQAALGIIRMSDASSVSASISKSQKLHAEIAALKHTLRQRFADGSLIGRSPVLRRILGQLDLAQKSTLPVLFVGETGTGRQHLARQIHHFRNKGQSAFVPLDCRRLPADQLADILRRLSGVELNEVFQPGTVYLDRIETLPRDLQGQVLELIESKNARKPHVIAASHVFLEPFVESDELISELYFGLTPLTIYIPPLRNRTEDIEPLAQFFLEELNRGESRQINGFHEDVWQQFRRYNWPGNVTELRTVVTEARRKCDGPMIEPSHLSFGFRMGVDRQSVGPVSQKRTQPLDPLLLEIEREQIELALAEARHNKAKAAELLAITRPRLYRRMEILGIADTEDLTNNIES